MKTKTIISALVCLAVMLPTLAACNPETPEEPIPATPAEISPAIPGEPVPTTPPTPKPPLVTPGESLTDSEMLVRGNSAFAFDLYHELKQGDANLFYSPYSISLALAMAYAGAGGETALQMADASRFLLTEERLHPTFADLGEELAQRGKGREMLVMPPDGGKEPTRETVEGFRLNIVNALWGQKGYKFLDEYLDLVEEYYGGGLKRLDFVNAPEPSRLEINKWASDETEGRIQDLLSPGDIDALTRLILTNAIYFKARWEHKFFEGATQDEPFHRLDGSEVTVPMMHRQSRFDYAEGDDYQAIRLPYFGGDMAMVVLLPSKGRFEAFEDSLGMDELNAAIAAMEMRDVRLALPKFEFETDYRLNDALSKLGMTDAFQPDLADFSGMTLEEKLWIDTVIHKAFVAVDEKGTEAAAVTAVVMAASAMPQETPEPVSFTADRPFIFLIQDIESGTILFIGRVMDPAA